MEHKDLRILVIDDEPVMADSLRTNLIDEGYSVDTAATGAEAIELFDQGGHHLAICDLQLPDMDGLEVMRHMKDARPTTEVIVVTGYGSVARAVEATKAGAFYFVEKPFDFEEIQPLVDKALERRELVEPRGFVILTAYASDITYATNNELQPRTCGDNFPLVRSISTSSALPRRCKRFMKRSNRSQNRTQMF